MAWNRIGSMKGFQLQKYFAKCNFTISFHGVINLKIWKRILPHKIQDNCWWCLNCCHYWWDLVFMRCHHLIPPDASFLFVICFPDYNDDDYNDDKDDAGNANHHYLVKGRKRGRRETLLLHCSSFHRSEPLKAIIIIGYCIYWRPQHWQLVVNTEVVNPECINYIYWRPYVVWFVFVSLRSGGWFGTTSERLLRL